MGNYNIKIFLHNVRKLFFVEDIAVPPFQFKTKGNIIAGIESYHNGNFAVKGNGILEIGNYCAIGSDVKIILTNHNFNYASMQYTFYRKNFGEFPYPLQQGNVVIGNDVWIGDNVIILPNVKIGNGAIIGANSTVTKDVGAFEIVGGNPARKIRKRFSEERIIELEEIKWWDWDTEKIVSNKDFFFTNMNDKNN